MLDVWTSLMCPNEHVHAPPRRSTPHSRLDVSMDAARHLLGRERGNAEKGKALALFIPSTGSSIYGKCTVLSDLELG